jgi:eukaryotic-like serine/threonine-protein kinase
MTIRLTLPKIGQVIDDRYRIDAEIKGGSYGMVYRGVDVGSGQVVAVKVLLPSAASNTAVLQRFEREVLVIQALSHPNIIEIYHAGLSSEGCLYYSMEFLEGFDLGTRLKQGRLSVKGAAMIAIQALMALEEAHSKDIIHRDLKPENIYLQNTPERKIRVRVLDFGIAKIVGERGENLPRLTLRNEACGTPSYMAPEQIMGETNVTAATDLYALGLLMIEMITARVAVEGLSYVDTLRKQVSEPVPLPAELEGNPVGAVIARATQKKPSDRYRRADYMRVELEAALRALSGG